MKGETAREIEERPKEWKSWGRRDGKMLTGKGKGQEEEGKSERMNQG